MVVRLLPPEDSLSSAVKNFALGIDMGRIFTYNIDRDEDTLH